MCWNAEVSLQSFLIGGFSIFFAYQKGLSLPITFFCMTIVGMQLVEYFVWSFYDNSTVNFQASVAAALLLFLQPIASSLTLPSKWISPIITIYLLLGGLLVLSDTTSIREKYKMTRGENGHLVWNWLEPDTKTSISLVVYFLFLFIPLLLTNQLTLLVLSLTTLGFSLFSYYKDNTWGSMWCWIINYLVVGVSFKQILSKV